MFLNSEEQPHIIRWKWNSAGTSRTSVWMSETVECKSVRCLARSSSAQTDKPKAILASSRFLRNSRLEFQCSANTGSALTSGTSNSTASNRHRTSFTKNATKKVAFFNDLKSPLDNFGFFWTVSRRGVDSLQSSHDPRQAVELRLPNPSCRSLGKRANPEIQKGPLHWTNTRIAEFVNANRPKSGRALDEGY